MPKSAYVPKIGIKERLELVLHWFSEKVDQKSGKTAKLLLLYCLKYWKQQ